MIPDAGYSYRVLKIKNRIWRNYADYKSISQKRKEEEG